jgi:pimeloyl-ACP methyl ester carboxylesterase
MRRGTFPASLLALLAALQGMAFAADPSAAQRALPRVTPDDLFAEMQLPDVSISPSGRYVAGVLVGTDTSAVFVTDLQTGGTRNIVGISRDAISKQNDAVISDVYWKSDDRLLFRMGIYPKEGARIVTRAREFAKLGDRLLAVDRDGSDLVPLLVETDSPACLGAVNLGTIASFLPHDPSHIVMTISGVRGRSLCRVNVDTGRAELVDAPLPAIVGWWLDVDGVPVVRIEEFSGSFRLRRKDAAGEWKVFYKIRATELDERPEYEAVGPSDVAGEYYVLARPEGRDRIGLYRYNLTKESFGEPVIEHPQYDLVSAVISRDGTQVRRYCYVAHVRTCVFADAEIDGHMRSVRRYFDDSANVSVYDASEDGKVLVLLVDGPQTPPSFHRYLVDRRRLESIGPRRRSLERRAMPRASVVEWKARDGLALTGYLTRPPAAVDGMALPLVVYPHGGPESRDFMTFDPQVQYFAARGYAVFQPNFRGSDGFGRAFAALGYGQWGRAMQDDVTDAVRHLIETGVADPRRVCIVGASYGGYAALAGAAFTPDLYRCAVSIAGISDLTEFVQWRKKRWGADSEGYTYWLKSIGDPATDAARLAATSPARAAAAIRIPVLLVHGKDDWIVPLSQSVMMRKALEKSGRSTELIELADEGHSRWSAESEKLVMSAIDSFLWEHLGPGHGVTDAPKPR